MRLATIGAIALCTVLMGCSSPQGRVTHVSVGDDVVFGEGGFDYG